MDNALCPVQNECGGCPNLGLALQAEHALKRDSVVAEFKKNAIAVEISELVYGQSRIGYRNRVRLSESDGLIGFFNPAKAGGCAVLRPELQKAIDELISLSADDRKLFAGQKSLEIRVSDFESTIGLRLPHNIVHTALETKLDPSWLISGPDYGSELSLAYRLAESLRIEVPIRSFVQVNSEVNRLIVSFVCAVANEVEPEIFLDLFAGAGNFSTPLIDRGVKGVAVETNPAAIKSLAANTSKHLLQTYCADARQTLTELKPADLLICNPPRSGLKHGHERFARLAKKTMLYIGCDPKTLAADIAELSNYGLKCVQAVPFDMFPGTTHVETVAVLSRR